MTETPTVGALLAEAATAFAAAGIAEPKREAVRVWAGLRNEEPGRALLAREASVEPTEVDRFLGAVRRRAAGEPLAYVTGLAGFRHLTLKSDARALIPRPETEGLVDLLLARVSTGAVLDVGTGTGCLALSLASEGRFGRVVASDRSAAALTLARENATLTALSIILVRTDLVAAFPNGAFDAIVSNPPYLTDREYRELDPAVRAWEPGSALASGADGMEHTTRLLGESARVLKAGGWLAVELDATRAQDGAAAARAAGWTDINVHHDLFGRERYLLARRSE